jgi:membrane protein required for beta-lactamase induction
MAGEFRENYLAVLFWSLVLCGVMAAAVYLIG